MSSQLLLTKKLSNDGWMITGRVTEASSLPKDIFVFENTGTNKLGPFFSVVMLDDFHRLKVWTGTPTPVVNNKYVRHRDLKILVPRTENVDQIIGQIVDSVRQFSSDYNSVKESTKTYVID